MIEESKDIEIKTRRIARRFGVSAIKKRAALLALRFLPECSPRIRGFKEIVFVEGVIVDDMMVEDEILKNDEMMLLLFANEKEVVDENADVEDDRENEGQDGVDDAEDAASNNDGE
ncbi:uncharacterized protein A4U43_C01F3410 [Asparagus officinalis]|uniref:Uncharacterized protein n=1 Tax=Asparagus officinalis TaxID=4686 RepID=A0A5P1FNZ4_ASPOF|nr:uncharacterized protein A4U43_C01F3410 [Asparagus officinalis]